MDEFLRVAIEEAKKGLAQGGIPIGSVLAIDGREDYVRSRGVEVVVVDDPECQALMEAFIATQPDLWNEDIGE